MQRLGTDMVAAVKSALLLDPDLDWGVFLDWKSMANHSWPAV